MRRLRRAGAPLVLAGLLAGLAMTVPAPVVRAENTTTSTLPSVFCDRLNSAINYLLSQPPSPLRDYLLQFARSLCQRYCTTCS